MALSWSICNSLSLCKTYFSLVSDSILNQNQYYNFNMSNTLEKFELYTFVSQQEKTNHWMKWKWQRIWPTKKELQIAQIYEA